VDLESGVVVLVAVLLRPLVMGSGRVALGRCHTSAEDAQAIADAGALREWADVTVLCGSHGNDGPSGEGGGEYSKALARWPLAAQALEWRARGVYASKAVAAAEAVEANAAAVCAAA